MTAPEQAPVRNRLLDSLPVSSLDKLSGAFCTVQLELHEVLAETGTPSRYVYFPKSCMLSIVVELENGRVIEATLVGNDGFAPVSAIFGPGLSQHKMIVQMAGEALRIGIDDFAEQLPDAPFYRALGAYTVRAQNVMAQSTGCVAFHPVEQRLARWLLMVRDAVERDEFALTQEFLGIMLGVHRPTVTVAVQALERAGLLEHRRGTLRIVDAAGLEAASCECYLAQRARD